MEPVGVDGIETAALGRPFQLGTLYDCRKDAIVPALTLWDLEKLKENIRSSSQVNTGFKVIASDSIEEKSSLLKIDGSLKLSLMGGLIQVTGAAKYLNDTKKSFIQQRLTLHYQSTTRFEELSMNHLASEKIDHDVFEHDTATHVVTAVLYGANACFLFDREVSSDENKTTVEGEVKAVYDKLKFIKADVNANLNMTDVQKKAAQRFTVSFYGDFQLPSNPTSFEDALKVFVDLPKLLEKNKDHVVPLRVWLYPLNKLYSKASKLQKEISINIISDIESMLESLNTTEMKCCDLLKDSPALALPAFHNQIKDMKKNCHSYKLKLVEKLGSQLPKIRGDQIKDSALTDLLNDHNESGFRESELKKWLMERKNESEVMKALLRQLKDSGATVEENLQAILMDLNVGPVVSYTFNSLDWTDVLKETSSKSENSRGHDDCKKNSSWLTPAIHKNMRNNLELFKNLIDSKERKPAKFIVSSKEMEDHPGSCILLYEDGCVEGVCFTPPSKPDPPKAEVKDDGVIINVPLATEELKLLYKMKHEQVWTSQPVPNGQNTVTLTDLRAGTEYEIKCAAVGKLNYNTDSDVITLISDSQRATEITRSLAEMLVKDLKPISGVKESGFVALVKSLDTQYQIPSCEELKGIIKQMYRYCKVKVMSALQKANCVTLMTERWTFRYTERYLTVYCHFMNNWQMHEFVLETISFPEDYIDEDSSCSELKRITEKWGITHKVTNSAKIRAPAVSKTGRRQDYSSFANLLIWLIKKAIYERSEVRQLLGRCNRIVSFFDKNTIATNLLKQKLICSNALWWNSTFYMLERLYEQWEAVNQILCEFQEDLCLTDTDISLIHQTLEALTPLERATRELLADRYVALSRVFPIVLDLHRATDSEHNALATELRKQYQDWLCRNENLAAIAFLDLRYKSVNYFNKDMITNVKKELFHLLRSAPAPPSSASHNTSVQHQPFTENDFENEMCRYEKEESIPSDQNPLDWWKNHENIFPCLSQLAKKHLGSIISFLPPNIIFPETEKVMCEKRDRLEEEDIDIFLFIHHNLQ